MNRVNASGKTKNKNKRCKDCQTCSELEYIGEGDSACMCKMPPVLVIEDWMPNENFFYCGGKKYKDKER